MTPAEFRAWRSAMGYTQQQAAQALGVSLRTVKAWESGETGAPGLLPLACAALLSRCHARQFDPPPAHHGSNRGKAT